MSLTIKRVLRAIAITCIALVGAVCLILFFFSARLLWTETERVESAAPSGGKWVYAYDTELHYQELGNANAPTLVLLSGTGAWAGTWVSNTQAMIDAGWRVIAIDLPPFGYSKRFKSMDYSRQAQAKRVVAALATLNLNQVTLLGHSYGGGPAAEATFLDSSRIAHLVLVDAAIGELRSNAPTCEQSFASQLLGIRSLRTSLVASVGTNPWMGEFLLKQFVSRQEVVTPWRTSLYQQPFNTKQYSAGLGDWAYEFVSGCEFAKSQTPSSYRAIKPALTLIWGKYDSVTPISQAHAIKALNSKISLVELPGVGHIPQIENPDLFNRSLVRAIQR